MAHYEPKASIDCETRSAGGRPPFGKLLDDQVALNAELLLNVGRRVQLLANHIVGNRPEEPRTDGVGLCGNGLLDALRSAMLSQRDQIERIMEDLARMETDLGL